MLKMNKSLVARTLLVGISLMSGNSALAQDTSDEDIKWFRQDVRSLKKQLIAANMSLTDSEAEQFWPISDRYTAELVTITDTKYALLKEYAQNYTTMTSEQAENYIKGRAAVEASVM
jgi:hypothetical protein